MSRMGNLRQALLVKLGSPFLALLLTSELCLAQFGEYGKAATTTSAQATAMQQAKEFLESCGEDFTGITLTNADLKGNLPAASTGTVIGIDFERLEQVVPPDTPGAPGHPGCVMILMFHE